MDSMDDILKTRKRGVAGPLGTTGRLRSKKVEMVLRLTPEQKEQLVSEAQRMGVAQSTVISIALARFFAQKSDEKARDAAEWMK